MNPLKTLVLFLFFTSVTFAQSSSVNDTIIASQYFKKADSLLNDKKLDSAISYFKKALSIYEKAKVWHRVSTCYNGIASSYYRNQDIQKSFHNAEKALYVNETYVIKDNAQKAITFDNIGNYYRIKNKYDKALIYYKKALAIRQNIYSEKHAHIAISYNNIGGTYYYKSNYKKTVFYFEKVLAIKLETLGPDHINIVGTYNNLAVLYDELGDLYKALNYCKKALAIITKELGPENKRGIGIYNNMGVTYFNLKQYDNALSCYKKILPICLKNNNLSDLENIYNNLGLVYRNRGEYSRALQYYNKSLEIKVQLHGNQHPKVGDAYMNIGVIYKNKNEFDKAQEYYSKALNTYEIAFGQKHIKIAEIYENIGNLHVLKEEYGSALEYQNKAFEIRENVFQKNSSRTIKSYGYIGDIYVATERLDNALSYYKKGLMILQSTYGDKHALTSEYYQNIATVYYELEEYDKAVDYLDKALISNSKDSTIDTNVFDIDRFYDVEILLENLYIKSKILKSRYLRENNILDLEQSNAVYLEVDHLINQVRQSFQNYLDKLSFADLTKYIYQGAIKTNLLLHAETKKQESLLNIFYYLEKSKSNALKDLLADANAKSFVGISSETIEFEKKLKTNRGFYQSQINEEFSKQEIDSTKITTYESKLFDISRKQDSLTEVLEKNYPKYHELKYNNEVISVAEIQQKLDDKTTLLEYFTGDRVTYAFTISKNKMAVKELPTSKLEELLERFQHSVTKNGEAHKAISYQLYQQLIAPVENELIGNQLIIVPDGALWHLNFDLLHTQQDSSNNPKTWPYLLKQYAISYANSATLLFGKDDARNDKNISNQVQECLAFSFSGDNNPSDTRTLSLNTLRSSNVDLPGTREEIKAIANIVDGQYFYGTNASEQNFKKFAGDYNVLHLAVHGDVDNERPENSKLYFTKSKDTLDDNFLYSHELFALDIPAELAVLSACNTGTGKIAKGEGIMSLGTAFQYAGTKSLVLTNWEVSDKTTPKIMEYFYSNLREGKNKAAALQQAKLQFLTTTSPETNHPYYWGGFYLLGDVAPIQFANNNYKYWMLGAGILAMILLSLFWYRKKISN